jgi:hypothetical protein
VGCEDAEACVHFDVSDSEIVTSLGIFAAMGAVLLVTFGSIRHQAPIFFGRRRLRNLVRGGRARATRRSVSRKTQTRTAFFFYVVQSAAGPSLTSLPRTREHRKLETLTDARRRTALPLFPALTGRGPTRRSGG